MNNYDEKKDEIQDWNMWHTSGIAFFFAGIISLVLLMCNKQFILGLICGLACIAFSLLFFIVATMSETLKENEKNSTLIAESYQARIDQLEKEVKELRERK